ncbi:Isochorismatase-like protein [Aspergillus heterothallicus]
MSPTSPPPLSFAPPYAILHLDLMPILINAIKPTAAGQEFISNMNKWINAAHIKTPRPLTIFSTLAFHEGQPELAPASPFERLIAPFGGVFERGSENAIDQRFSVDEYGGDIVLEKTRWSATVGNALEQILRARGIKTVVISGITLSGVVMATVYRLFDLDYNVYVIRDNVIDLPVEDTERVSSVMLDVILPRMGFWAISLQEALEALERS